MATLPALVSILLAVAVAANPEAYEQNLVTALFLSCAWVLQEMQSVVVVRSLILALLQGEACHRTFASYGMPSSNIFWVTVFSLMQEDAVGVARLVAALAICYVAFVKLWNTAIVDALITRSQPEYWLPIQEDRRTVGQRPDPDNTPGRNGNNVIGASLNQHLIQMRRSELGAVLQLLITRRMYDMLSRRSRSSRELREALQQFLDTRGLERGSRDRFTMAVISAMSRQGTATVIRTAESSHVGKFASRAAAFVERKFTTSAVNRVEALFKPLPFGLDPAEQNGWQTFALLLAVLTVHKRLFQEVKAQPWFKGRTQKMGLFLTKQTTRIFLVFYLLVRYILGVLRRAEPIAPWIVTPSLLGEVRRQGNDSILASPSPPRRGPWEQETPAIPNVSSVIRLDSLGTPASLNQTSSFIEHRHDEREYHGDDLDSNEFDQRHHRDTHIGL